MTDRELIADFSELYDHFFDQIYRFVYRRVSHRENVEDIVSETFSKVYKHLPLFVPEKEGVLSSWIYTIAKNEVFQFLRKNKHHSSVDLDDIPEIPSGDNIPGTLNNEQWNTLLRHYLTFLPREEREIILYKYFDELSNQEIAVLSGITPNHVGVRLHRALRKLKHHLTENNITI